MIGTDLSCGYIGVARRSEKATSEVRLEEEEKEDIYLAGAKLSLFLKDTSGKFQ